MRVVAGLGGTLALFAASFALHIVGGATDQGWLFATAVVLIYLSAAGFPAIALLVGRPERRRERMVLLALATSAGLALTAGALWAANDRAWAWWQLPLTPALVIAMSGAILWLAGRRGTRRVGQRAPAPQ